MPPADRRQARRRTGRLPDRSGRPGVRGRAPADRGAGRLHRDRDRWLKLAAAAGAPADRAARLSAAEVSERDVEGCRTLYLGTVERAIRAARRERRWEDAARIRRAQALVLYRVAGSPVPPPDGIVRLHRDGTAAELRGIAGIAREAELVGATCCDACRADDGRTLRITAELRVPRLPHEGCPRGLCRCRWDLPHDIERRFGVTCCGEHERIRQPARASAHRPADSPAPGNWIGATGSPLAAPGFRRDAILPGMTSGRAGDLVAGLVDGPTRRRGNVYQRSLRRQVSRLHDRRRLLAIFLLALAGGIGLAGMFARGELGGVDARAYWAAVRIWLNGGDPYHPASPFMPYVYAPWLLPAFTPWALLPWDVAWFVWRGGTILLLLWTVAWAYRRRPLATAAVAVVLAFPVFANLDTGNINLVLVLVLWGARFTGPRTAGLFWALATAIKWVPAVFLGILAPRARLHGVLFLAIAGLLTLATLPLTIVQLSVLFAYPGRRGSTTWSTCGRSFLPSGSGPTRPGSCGRRRGGPGPGTGLRSSGGRRRSWSAFRTPSACRLLLLLRATRGPRPHAPAVPRPGAAGAHRSRRRGSRTDRPRVGRRRGSPGRSRHRRRSRPRCRQPGRSWPWPRC